MGEENRKKLYEAPEFSTDRLAAIEVSHDDSSQQNAIEGLERRLRALEEKRQQLLDVESKSINLNAISELERQLQNVADDRKIVKEGPVNALESERRRAIRELDEKLDKIQKERHLLREVPDQISAQQNAVEGLERHLRALEEKRKELLDVDNKSINLDAIKELEKQLKEADDERKIVKEGPLDALESERKLVIKELE